jgi:hypothetical protein
MHSQSNNEKYSVLGAIGIANDLFGLTVDEYQMVNLMEYVFRQTGGLVIEPILIKKKILNKCVHLKTPGIRTIEFVTTSKSFDFYKKYTSDYPDALVNYNPNTLQNYITEEDVDDCYFVGYGDAVIKKAIGELVPFQNKGNCELHFNPQHEGMEIDIFVHALIFDEEGYPMVTYNTLTALAHYMNMIHIRIEFYKQRASGDMMRFAAEDFAKSCAQARVPLRFSDNEWNDVLNVATSFGRKSHNVTHRQSR